MYYSPLTAHCSLLTIPRSRRQIAISGGPDTCSRILSASSLVVLLTKQLLLSPVAIIDIFLGIQGRIPIITVLVDHGGYDFESASKLLSDPQLWERELGEARSKALTALLLRVGGEAVTLENLQGALLANLLPVIAIPWQPQGGANHVAAVMADLEAAIPASTKVPTSSCRWLTHVFTCF